MADNNANFDLLEKAITLIKNKNDKQKPDTQLKCRAARVVSYDNKTFQAIVCFIDDNQNNEYALINKTNEKLSENDTVKVFYTTNVAKGWIGARMGEPVIDIYVQPNSQGAGTLFGYNVLSDTSVKYNGVTYTAELADSGLISKITDDKGGEFEPTYADGVTDVALHNATFLAVAMISGLKKPTSGWVLMGLIHQNTEVVTEPKSFNTNLGEAPNEFTIEVCMRFYGVGNTSSNQACTVFHVGVATWNNNNLRLATCDYHPEAYTYLWGGAWAEYESNQDYTTFPSHKGELATSTLVIKKTSDSSSEVKVYSNGELRDTNVTGWQSLNLSNYVLLDNKSFERKALGTIYQVRIYSRALTDAEVAQNVSEDRHRYG